MFSKRNTLLGLYYLVIGLVFSIPIWLFGKEVMRLIAIVLGIVLIINGVSLLFLYSVVLKYDEKIGKIYLADGLIRIVAGLVIIFVDLRLISMILGMVLLVYTVLTALLTKKIKDLYGKSLYKIIIAVALIFCGLDLVGLWILRIVDILVIIYGIILMINRPKYQNNVYPKSDNNYIDAEFEEAKDE